MKVNHDIRSNAGRTLYMPEYYEGENGFGNLALPDVYAADDQTTLYPRGVKLVQGERVFYYGTYRGVANTGASAATVTATNGDDLFGKFLFTCAYQQDMANGLLVRKLGDELSIVYQTTVDDGARADNWYSGGWVCGKDTTPSDERMFMRRIVKHDYQATGLPTQAIWNESNGSYTTVDLSSYSQVSVLELDQPVTNAKTSMATTIMQNEWKHGVWLNDSGYNHYRNCLGACMHNDPTATRHVWFQTWGPMFCPHVHAATVGAVANERVVILMADGSVQVRESTYDYMDSHYPVIGHILSDTKFELASLTDEGLPMIYVQWRR